MQLSDIICINRNKKLYKVKIENVEIWRFLISNYKQLKDSTFRNVFINGYLTYKQSRELFGRREEARQLITHSGDPTATYLNS